MRSERTVLTDDAEKAIFTLRVLQVMPTEPQWAIDLQEVMTRLVENFNIKDDSKLKTRVSYQLKNLTEYQLLIESEDSKRRWYRNAAVDLDLSAPDLDTLSTLSVLAKISDKLFKHSSDAIHAHVENLTNRFKTISHFERVNLLSNRFEYADFLLTPNFNPQHQAILITLQKALLEDCVVSILYRPRDSETLKVDVGLALGIVQKSNLQTLVLLARAKKDDKTVAETVRISIDRIVLAHLRKNKGEFERYQPIASDNADEIWYDRNNNPELKFQEFLKASAGGMLMRKPLSNGMQLPTRTGESAEHEAGDPTDVDHCVRFVAHVHSHLKAHLETLKLSDDQAFTPLNTETNYQGTNTGDRWYELTATVIPSENFEWWIMSWAERIVVLEPTFMGKRISHRIARAAANYKTCSNAEG
ncbi:WYL domain-containing protein [Pseudidiomarina mangrovi]|uniref:WYL domain-containing protein n=1 Tax=Pseudidiomarina mangrovi TaxID=2487133 RepID=UPI0013DF7797|nr:WYL domain-containing protein [Pseudidiomarina mangrovi]